MQGDDGSRVTVNVPSTGRVPNGATVERMVPTTLGTTESPGLNLNSPDFTTAARLDGIDQRVARRGHGASRSTPSRSAYARPPARVRPRGLSVAQSRTSRWSRRRAAAKVIVNSRTGTVVIGSNCARHTGRGGARLAGRPHHGDGAREPTERVRATADTVVVGQSDIDVDQGEQPHVRVRARHGLNDIVEAVNQSARRPATSSRFSKPLREAGALRAAAHRDLADRTHHGQRRVTDERRRPRGARRASPARAT